MRLRPATGWRRRRAIALLAGAAVAAGCSSSLPPLREDAPLARAEPEAPDPALARDLLARAEAAFEERPDRDRVEESADLAIRSALADPERVEPVVLATRAYVWLASHRDGDRGAADRAARDAVETGQACRSRAPGLDDCDYWLALAVGVRADVRRSTAVDALRRMVELLRAAIDTVPEIDHAGPFRVLARVLVNAPGWPSGPGDPDEGLVLAREAVRRAPYWPPNALALGEALRKTGQRDAARQAYSRALELARAARDTDHPDAGEWIDDAEDALDDLS